MTNSRQKGAAGEREVAKELFRHLGLTFKRDLRQYQDAEFGDLVCEDDSFPFSIEVKRYAKGWTCKPAWEVQACRAAKNAQRHPAIVYRYDGQGWRVRVWFNAIAEAMDTTAACDGKADMSIDDFAWISREIMNSRGRI